MRAITDIVIHCSATRPNQNIGASEIDKWHCRRGFRKIGYHKVIRLNGIVEDGRSILESGAHVKGKNRHSIGVCYVGGLDQNGKPKNTVNDDQQISLMEVVRDLQMKFPWAKVRGHRDYSPDLDGDGIIQPDEFIKACPCFDVVDWCNDNCIDPK